MVEVGRRLEIKTKFPCHLTLVNYVTGVREKKEHFGEFLRPSTFHCCSFNYEVRKPINARSERIKIQNCSHKNINRNE